MRNAAFTEVHLAIAICHAAKKACFDYYGGCITLFDSHNQPQRHATRMDADFKLTCHLQVDQHLRQCHSRQAD